MEHSSHLSSPSMIKKFNSPSSSSRAPGGQDVHFDSLSMLDGILIASQDMHSLAMEYYFVCVSFKQTEQLDSHLLVSESPLQIVFPVHCAQTN